MKAKSPPGAIVLLSGGLDSATALYIALAHGYECTTLAFDYGQRHRFELKKSRALSGLAGAREHIELRLDPGLFRNTALVGGDIDVPEHRLIDDSIPVTYVPGRNILFLAHALALGESISAFAIFIGVNALDYSGYPDCRPEFIKAFEEMARLGLKTGQEGQAISIQTPLLSLSKAEIIKQGLRLGVDYGMTSSCYNPGAGGQPCQACDSCVLRARGFAEAGVPDPILVDRA